jgi:septal ring factor EnvC (AmiA/AmiB activator)
MPDDEIFRRLSALEQKQSAIEARLDSELRHIESDLKDLKLGMSSIDSKLDETNVNIASINTNGQLARQHSTWNEKIIFAIIAFVVGAAAFVLGKVV